MRILRVVLLGLTVFSVPEILICQKSSGEETPRFVMVLLDETESFRIGETQFWPEVRSWAVELARRLQPGEGFGVIGIDDHGFDPGDIRVDMRILDERTLMAIQQRNEIIKNLKDLPRRHLKRPRTDILGALKQVADLLKDENDHRCVVVIFSDMIQTPKMPTVAMVSGSVFPKGTEVYCFYVNATTVSSDVEGQRSWNNIVNTWRAIFDRAGLKYETEPGHYHFYQRGNTRTVFDRVFPK
jgi:hypothetical protein